MTRPQPFALLAALLLASCAVGDPSTDRAGNPIVPTVVTIGTDSAVDANKLLLEIFGERVAALSGGSVEIEVRRGGENVVAWDQRTIEMSQNGDFDGVVVRAGAWHAAGVRSLDVLQLPGLVESDAQADRLVRDRTLVGRLLDDTERAGFTGLGLFPEAPRYLMLLDGTTEFSAASLAGRAIRAPFSETLYAVLRAMGMEPVDVEPGRFIEAVGSGEVTATEGQLARVALTTTAAGDSTAAVAANMPIYTKFNVLAIRSGSVSDDVMQVLRTAASDALDRYLDSRLQELAGLDVACAAGGVIVEVEDQTREQLMGAASSVVDELASGEVGDLFDDVRAAVGRPERPSLGCPALRGDTETESGAGHDGRAAQPCASSDCQTERSLQRSSHVPTSPEPSLTLDSSCDQRRPCLHDRSRVMRER